METDTDESPDLGRSTPSCFVRASDSESDSTSVKAVCMIVNVWNFLRGVVLMSYSGRDLEAHRIYDKSKKPCCGTIYEKVKITVLVVMFLGVWFAVFDPYMRRLGTEKSQKFHQS